MTCSLQTYRIRIGTFQTGTHLHKKKVFNCKRDSNINVKKTSFILALIISNYCLLALSFPTLLQPHHPYPGPAWQQQPGSYTVYTACIGCQAPSVGTARYFAEINGRQSEVWDPGTNVNISLLHASPHTPTRSCPRGTRRKETK